VDVLGQEAFDGFALTGEKMQLFEALTYGLRSTGPAYRVAEMEAVR
jgi:hypothetical protein